MKKGWETKELAAVSAINYGYTESASSKPIGPRFLRITDIQDDHVDWDNVPYCKIEKNDLPKYRLATGDIVFARTGATTGKSFLVDEPPDAVFASYLIRLRLTDKKLLPEFVQLFFQTAGYWQSIKDGSSGSAQGGFNATKLGALSIPVPPLSEQERIVAKLDKAFAGLTKAKENAENNLQNARALFESHLQFIFTQRGSEWVEKPFEDCIEDVKYTAKIQRKDFLEEGEFPIVSQETELTNGFWGNAADVFKATRPVVIFGDHTQVLKYIDFDFVLGADGVKILQPKPFLNPKFFFYALRSVPLKSLGYARHFRLLKELQIGYPDMNTQDAIAKKLNALTKETQRLAGLYEQKLEALESLKKSILHEAFSGNL